MPDVNENPAGSGLRSGQPTNGIQVAAAAAAAATAAAAAAAGTVENG